MRKNDKCGIYIITSLVDGKVYIGQSIELAKRWDCHRSNLKHNCNRNKHLQRTYNLYGIDNFKFSIIECCSVDELDAKEKHWIDYYNSTNDKFGYNFESGGNANKFMSPAIRKKISVAKKGVSTGPCSEETKFKIAVANMGNKHCLGVHPSEETKRKQSEAKKFKSSQEMIDDIKAGISNKDFISKYQSDTFKGQRMWTRLRKEFNIKHKATTSIEVQLRTAASSKGIKRAEERRNRMLEGDRAYYKRKREEATL